MSSNSTPLRYPGGKQRLTPFVREILSTNGLAGGHYVEPYAGGAGVAMELLIAGDVQHVHLNDSCEAIYSIWMAITHDTEEFCRRIQGASLTIEQWRRHKHILSNSTDYDHVDVGFSAFYLNRTNRSGILSGGVIGGLNQDGNWKMDARFPRNELIRRVEIIGSLHDRITLTNMDAEVYLTQQANYLPQDTLIYCDPPYYNKSGRLYLNKYQPEDHIRISGVIQNINNRPWLVSYDSTPEILSLYNQRQHFVYALQYQAARAYTGSELFVFSDDLTVPNRSTLSFIDYALRTTYQPATTELN